MHHGINEPHRRAQRETEQNFFVMLEKFHTAYSQLQRHLAMRNVLSIASGFSRRIIQEKTAGFSQIQEKIIIL
jgi:hypothetical protein